MLFFKGKNGRCFPLSWNANEIQHIVRCTIAVESSALVRSQEDAIIMKYILNVMLDSEVPTIWYTDNYSLCGSLHSTNLLITIDCKFT